jgi:hypothetical protein
MARGKGGGHPGKVERHLRDLVAVAREHIDDKGIYRLPVAHNDWCPTIRTQRIEDCICEPHYLPPERIE